MPNVSVQGTGGDASRLGEPIIMTIDDLAKLRDRLGEVALLGGVQSNVTSRGPSAAAGVAYGAPHVGLGAAPIRHGACGGMRFDRVHGIQPRDGLAWEAMRRFQITYQMP
jgi:hypothetical protein